MLACDRHALVTPTDLGVALGNVAAYLGTRNQHADAAPVADRAIDALRAADATEALADILHTRGNTALLQDDLAAAEQDYTESLELRRSSAGEDDPRVAGTLAALARVKSHNGDHGGAIVLLEDALRRIAAVEGRDHTYALVIAGNLACELAEAGESARATELVHDCAERATRQFGDGHPLSAAALANVALLADDLDDVARGVAAQRALDAHVAIGEGDDPACNDLRDLVRPDDGVR